MRAIKGFLAFIGFLVVLGLLYVGVRYGGTIAKMDSGALGAYGEMAHKVLATGDPAKGMILKKKIEIPEGMSKEEAIEAVEEKMDEIAEKYGLMKVGAKRMRKDPVIKIREYCSPSIGRKFIAYSPEFVGFMPCRVGIIEDPETGDIYLYTMSLDLMIHGGAELPEDLKKLAYQVRDAMYGMLEEGAKVGDI